MIIPSSYLGLWQGEVTDSNRVNSYIGVICLDANEGETWYQMARYKSTGVTKGKLTDPVEKEGGIVLHEHLYAGASSLKEDTLSLKLVDEERLECVWGAATAVMPRIEAGADRGFNP